jgi:hypothetical protein
MFIKSIKFGYIWLVGDGKKVRLWEDAGLGSIPLAVQGPILAHLPHL